MKILAVIPARGGSKGIPRKNIRLVAGKPLIVWSIEAALRACCVDRVIVSTDDDEIAAVSREYGAEVVMRPDEISGDTASSESALLHVLNFLNEAEGLMPDVLLMLQCTSPLTTSGDIDAVAMRLAETGADCAFTAVPFHYFLWKDEGNGGADGINHDPAERLMRQQREPEYLETGAIYGMKIPGFLKAKHRFFGKITMVQTPVENCLEIDDPFDLEHADYRLSMRKGKPELPRTVEALVLDFDGVLTDNRVIVHQDGHESVACSRADGMGIERVRKSGICVFVLSKERNDVVAARCKKLNVEYLHGQDAKAVVLKDWAMRKKIDLAHVVYVGNDVNDLECMQMVGCAVAVKDSHPDVLKVADWVLSKKGGWGAVREVCDYILNAGAENDE